MLRKKKLISKIEYFAGDGIIIGGDAPAKMKYSCGKMGLVGLIILLFSILVFDTAVPTKVGSMAFLAGVVMCVAIPAYYNYLARRCIVIVDGKCKGYIEHENKIRGFLVTTSAGDIPVIGERSLPIKGNKVRVYLKVRRLPFMRVRISSVYSFEQLETALAE